MERTLMDADDWVGVASVVLWAIVIALIFMGVV
jgi:hypothetical protein